MPSRELLIIEDTPNAAAPLALRLQTARYRVRRMELRHLNLLELREVPPRLILLDLAAPGEAGRQWVTRLRTASDVPILVLSPAGPREAQFALLDHGATRCLVKPCRLDEVLAWIASAGNLRTVSDQPLTVGGLQLRPSDYLARYQGQEVELTPTEFELLAYLMQTPGRLCSSREILVEVFGGRSRYQVVALHIMHLRRKLEAAGLHDVIRTVRGAGYRFQTGPPPDR